MHRLNFVTKQILFSLFILTAVCCSQAKYEIEPMVLDAIARSVGCIDFNCFDKIYLACDDQCCNSFEEKYFVDCINSLHTDKGLLEQTELIVDLDKLVKSTEGDNLMKWRLSKDFTPPKIASTEVAYVIISPIAIYHSDSVRIINVSRILSGTNIKASSFMYKMTDSGFVFDKEFCSHNPF